MSEYLRRQLFTEIHSKGNCIDCNGSLTLFEEDFKNKTRVLVCERCGLVHLYKKTFLSGWKLIKVRKKSISFE